MTLKDWMDQTDTTREDIAAKLYVDPATVWRWCAGQAKPTVGNLRRLRKMTKGAVTQWDEQKAA